MFLLPQAGSERGSRERTHDGGAISGSHSAPDTRVKGLLSETGKQDQLFARAKQGRASTQSRPQHPLEKPPSSCNRRQRRSRRSKRDKTHVAIVWPVAGSQIVNLGAGERGEQATAVGAAGRTARHGPRLPRRPGTEGSVRVACRTCSRWWRLTKSRRRNEDESKSRATRSLSAVARFASSTSPAASIPRQRGDSVFFLSIIMVYKRVRGGLPSRQQVQSGGIASQAARESSRAFLVVPSFLEAHSSAHLRSHTQSQQVIPKRERERKTHASHSSSTHSSSRGSLLFGSVDDACLDYREDISSVQGGRRDERAHLGGEQER